MDGARGMCAGLGQWSPTHSPKERANGWGTGSVFRGLFRISFGDGALEGLGHFGEDLGGGAGGVGGLGDGSADDEVAGAEAEGIGGGADALLVAEVCAGGADAGDDEDGLRSGEGSNGGDLLRRADEAGDACVERHAGEEECLFARRAVVANGLGLCLVNAGEHGDGEKLGRGGQIG